MITKRDPDEALMEPLPKDKYNAELVANVRPPDWKNPKPAPIYNLVVIGAGPAGLVTAAGAAELGAKVALVEKNLMGGDCLNAGCVPSKTIARSARYYADLHNAADFGGHEPARAAIDFAKAMEHMRRIRAQISHHDSAERFRDLGVDVFLGRASFNDPHTVKIDDLKLKFKKAVIATGTHAARPSIEGLEQAGYLTNESVFNLTERPKRLLVIGGGPLGCELAQAFCRLGCEVTIVHRNPQFLPKEERDAAQILAYALKRDGVQVRLNTEVQKVTQDSGEKRVHLISAGQESIAAVDEIFVGAGRAPNVDGLNLEAANVRFDAEKGVHVNDFMQTSNSCIYAAGDVAVDHKFAHMADATARIVIHNALFFGRKKLSALTVPWCTYTDPEIAHVGIYVREAHEKAIPLKTFTIAMSDLDRAVADGESEGFVKIHVKEGTDKILGATIVARHAGEMINEISLAMVAGVGLRTIGCVIHSYPTQAEAIRKAADAYLRTRLTPFIKRLTARWLRWQVR